MHNYSFTVINSKSYSEADEREKATAQILNLIKQKDVTAWADTYKLFFDIIRGNLHLLEEKIENSWPPLFELFSAVNYRPDIAKELLIKFPVNVKLQGQSQNTVLHQLCQTNLII